MKNEWKLVGKMQIGRAIEAFLHGIKSQSIIRI